MTDLTEGEVYLVEATGHWSLIGEYAGRDDGERLVFVPGPLSPLHIPEREVQQVTLLTGGEE